ncbi:hypothetical protein OSB04_028632 [Centaurea solstitialis]|uniref:Transposase n=1 Tax=Centaurea solstitialis TaxID=347529 RepID=A0AA38ST08_9ASTR|nr:hypothetical protein OSB04_028632 [Centaurea solstitialis]
MSIDKTWTTLPPTRKEFWEGLDSFVERAKSCIDSGGRIRCPCKKCVNNILMDMTTMKNHVSRFGFSKHYDTWIYHGESRTPPVVNDVAPSNEMAGAIDDIMGEHMENDTNHVEGNSDTDGIGVDDGFLKLLEEVNAELSHPVLFYYFNLLLLFIINGLGLELLAAKLMHIKVNNKWIDGSFDQLLELLQSAFPDENRVPSSHYIAKKKLKKIGLGYESIHVCKNDCILFWKEHESLQHCPVCRESRWVNKNTKGKKVAHKVLRYFPLTSRLQRLYCSRHTVKNMIWHNTGRSEDGVMRHPVDGSSWKEFDMKYPNFSKEPRNVRLGLAADGFNPFGSMSSAHSTWPVVVTTYNLPPWLCMKESSFMLTLLIPGPKSPGKDMDVFLRPLVEELKHLWNTGVRTKDAATNTFFTMKAMLLWTINDFPASSSLSGWSGQGYKACPTCNEDTPSCRLTNKIAFVGHRRFLDPDDPWRTSLEFNGQHETRAPPRQFSNEEIKAQLDRLPTRTPGKHPDFGGVKRKREDFELNWSKRSIFFELEYWSSLQLKHNLDVMHIEKNVCDSLLGTLLMNDKSKDTANARIDLENLKIRKPLWLKKRGNKFFKPQPKYSFTDVDRKLFCQFIKGIKLPDGFGSNISKKVTDNDTNIAGLKSHDCHILMQRLIPIGVRGFLAKDKSTPIVELCNIFKQLCSRTLMVEDMRKAKAAIVTILCKLEMIYPPAFFDIMVHLVLHLPDEAICGGPVYMRWMYPFERYMKKLKHYVRNKARPEGSIAEGYVAEEALTFCSMYLQDVQTRFNRPERNEDVIVEKTKLWVFESKCRPTSGTQAKHLDVSDKKNLEWFVLDSCEEVRQYMNEFKAECPQSELKTEFPTWFLNKVYEMKTQNSPLFHEELSALSMGARVIASTYTACIVNGVRFMVLSRDAQRTTQNSGVLVEGESGEKYYGQLEEIIELHYPCGYSTVLFQCKWFDTRSGVRCENNITSIDTRREWHKEDQLIFATQAKQVFYIREPSRGDQSNNHRWVVENVNHRKIWDLPINEARIEDVNNDSAENVDVVHYSCSSNCIFVIDLSRFFDHSVQSTGEVEVSVPTHTVNEVSDEEIGFDENDSDDDCEMSEGDTEMIAMAFIWILALYLMADVMGRGHDGDGSEDPPCLGGRLRGQHKEDAVPPTKRRGKGKNLNLKPMWEANGKRPLPLEYDGTTFTPVGPTSTLLTREASLYMVRNIPLDKESWKKVPEAEKNALYTHLQTYFDIQDILEDPGNRKFREGVEFVISRLYRNRKNDFKEVFLEKGGYDDLETARANPPDEMSGENWNKVIDFFCTDKHKRRSDQNKVNKAKQVVPNRGGTSSYSNACHKFNKSKIQNYGDVHRLKDGTFDNPRSEEQYNALLHELNLETQNCSSSNNSTSVDEASIFERVLGARRGHIKGVGYKPSQTTSSAQSRVSRPTQPSKLDRLLSNPRFKEAMAALVDSFSNEDDEAMEDDEATEDDNREE